MIQVVIVDDHQLVIDGLNALLKDEKDITVVAQANNGQDGLRYIQSLRPDIVLLDIDMPVMNGLVTAEKIKDTIPEVKVIMLSLHRESSILKHVIKLGVEGYVMKSAARLELIQAIYDVSQGKKYFGTDVALALSEKENKVASVKLIHDDSNLLATLSVREREVLIHIAEGHTNKEIAELLYVSQRTIDAHRASIMKKLNVKNVVGLVRFALRMGLLE